LSKVSVGDIVVLPDAAAAMLIREGWAELFSELASICVPPSTDRLDMFVQLVTMLGVPVEIIG
jgi:hypothetical protein